MSDQPRLTDAPPRVHTCACSEHGPCPAHALPLYCWWCDTLADGTVTIGRRPNPASKIESTRVPSCADHAADHRGFLPMLQGVAS